MKKLSLATWIFIGLALGILAGLLFMKHPDFAVTYIKPFGTLFLNLIKLVVVPIVLFSIISGVISLSDIRKVGSIGVKTIVFYMVTTMFAITLGLLFGNLFHMGSADLISSGAAEYTIPESPSLFETLLNIFPSNVIEPLLSATMLQIIVIAVLFGFGIILAGDKGKLAGELAESLSEVSLKVMGLIIKLSPIGVFALICPVVAENGPSILGSLMKLILVAYLVYMVHAVLVYSTMARTLAGISPLKFFKGMFPAMMLAFSSASSVGTLPLNLECCEKLGARNEVASFILPLGATINMDGTAIYQGVSVIFIAQVFGVDLTLTQMITIVLTATLASIGTAGVPGSGVVMLAMVLESVGLPLEGIALVAGVDRILDMGRTTVNITGDAACTLSVDAIEKRKELKKKQLRK